MDTQLCVSCNRELPLRCYAVRQKSPLKYRGECRECRNVRAREWTEKNKEHRREYERHYRNEHPKYREQALARGRRYYKKDPVALNRKKNLQRNYGITPADYDRMFQSQNGVCAICGQPEIHIRMGKLIPLSVDHCHLTGKIRQLLCSNCNRMLGMAKDNIETMRKGIEYLIRHSTETESSE